MSRGRGFLWIDGRLLPSDQPCLRADDRGFLYGDGLFETLRVYRGEVFALEEHLARLKCSARRLRLPLPRVRWEQVIRTLLDRNGLAGADAWVRLVVTRGSGGRGPAPPRRARPVALAMAGAIDRVLARRQRRGIRVVLLPFARGGGAAHKMLAYGAAVLGRIEAERRGADDAIYTAGGRLLEATTASLFAVRNGRLLTPSGDDLLPGITRGRVLDLAAADGIPAREVRLRVHSTGTWQEAFLASSVAEIVPVIAIDGRPVGTGAPGPFTRRLQQLYRAAVARTAGRTPSAAAR